MTAPAQPIDAPSRARRRLAAAASCAACRCAWRSSSICFLWTMPTLGLLVTSVRNPALISTSGWWTALLNPFAAQPVDAGELPEVLASGGMGNAFLNSLIVTIPSTVIPITIAAFAAYAFAWIPFRGRGILFTIVVALLVVPIQMSLIPILQDLQRRGTCTARSSASGWRTRASACRSRSSCSTTSSRSCRATCSSRPRSTAPRTSRRSSGSSCRCRFRRSAPSRSSSSCGSGTTCWSRWSSWARRPMSGSCRRRSIADRQPRRRMASPHRRRVHDDDRAAGRLPAAPAGIRPRDPGRLRQVVTRPAQAQPHLRAAPTPGDEPLIPARAVLRRAALAVEVDVDQAEPPAVAEAPLVVVEQRPDVVAGQRHARARAPRRPRRRGAPGSPAGPRRAPGRPDRRCRGRRRRSR